MRTSHLVIVASLLLVGCARAITPAPAAATKTPAPAAVVVPGVAAAPAAPAVPAAAAAAAAVAPAPDPAHVAAAAAPADGAPPAPAVACGAAGHDKDAPGCPGMPAAAAVGDNPAAAPAAAAAPGALVPSAVAASKIVGKVYGKGVSDVPTVQISALLADVEKYVGKRVRVEGLVKDVCPMRGCWFNLAGDKPGTDLRFKVRDGVMVFPMSAKGQFAVAEGVVRKIPLDLKQTKRYMAHQAEEKGEKFDPATVKAPMTLVRLDGVGAVLRDQK